MGRLCQNVKKFLGRRVQSNVPRVQANWQTARISWQAFHIVGLVSVGLRTRQQKQSKQAHGCAGLQSSVNKLLPVEQ